MQTPNCTSVIVLGSVETYVEFNQGPVDVLVVEPHQVLVSACRDCLLEQTSNGTLRELRVC